MKGDNGIFDVEVDGELIYSKHRTGRFPEDREVIDAIAACASSSAR